MNSDIDYRIEHKAELVKVKSIYRGEYEKQGLMLFFKLLNTETIVHRTLCIPRSLHGKKTLFHSFARTLVDYDLSDTLLSKPNKLAKQIETEALGKEVMLKIAPGSNGYLNIEKIGHA